MDADVSMIFQEKRNQQFQEELSELLMQYHNRRELYNVAAGNYFSLSKDELGEDFAYTAMHCREIYESTLSSYNQICESIASFVASYSGDISLNIK